MRIQSTLQGPCERALREHGEHFILYFFFLVRGQDVWGILVLRFDEPVTPSSLVSSRITLQSERSSTPEASYQLPSGIPSTTASESTTLSVSLTSEAINILKATSNLAKSVNDTFLSVETGAVRDVYLNDLESVSPAFALQVSSYTQDMTDPMLNSFTLDLDTSQLILNLT